jgi:hypothetical protein
MEPKDKEGLERMKAPLVKVNGKWADHEGCTRLRLPEFVYRLHMKVVRLSAPRTSRIYPPGDAPGTHFC